MAIPALTFVVVVALVLGAYWAVVLRPEQKGQAALKRRLRRPQHDSAVVKQEVVRGSEPLSTLPFLERLLRRQESASEHLRQFLDSSGLKLTVGRFLLGSAFFAVAVFVLVSSATHILALALVAGVLAGAAPTLFVKYKRDRRLQLFEEQFPEAIDLIARALRAGHAFTTGLGMVADEIGPPVGAEFRMLYDWQSYGMSLPDALRRFADRVPLLDARFFVTSVLVQRESGGNLSEVLDNLSRVTRDRFRVKRQIRVVSAHGRITGLVLTLFPPFLAAMFYSMSPQHMTLMITDPLGIRMIIGAVILQILGALVIRRLINIEY